MFPRLGGGKGFEQERILAKERTSTGIDLGTRAVKVVRFTGGEKHGRVTHAGALDLESGEATGNDLRRLQGEGLVRLLEQLKLKRRALGRLVVGISGSHVTMAEADLPPLSERELRKALPFESRKHLFLDAMKDPVLDCQILARTAGENPEIRVLFVAASREERDAVLAVLRIAGLDPDVVDALPLAYMNALAAQVPPSPDGPALAILDLGFRRAGFYVCHPDGAVVCRELAAGIPNGDAEVREYAADLSRLVNETAVFFRGRHRREIDRVHLAGGGALHRGVVDQLKRVSSLELSPFDPIAGSLPKGNDGTRLVGAYGLCRARAPRV